jgi:tRNA wybutosine-synthesizing protein 1
VRGYNLERPEQFARLIEKANPDYIEPKGYVHVGYSRRRLERSDMPTLDEVMDFSRRLSEATGYEVKDYSAASKVALLKRQ